MTVVTLSFSRAIVHNAWMVYMDDAVADQRQHRPVRAGNGRAHGAGQALPDGAAGERDEVVRAARRR